jgi:hypothetical protein
MRDLPGQDVEGTKTTVARYLRARTDVRAPKNRQGSRARSSMSKTGFMAWQILPCTLAIKCPARR